MVTIVSIFNRQSSLIEPQLNSIIKNIKCEYEYIIFNNAAVDDIDEVRNINLECSRLNINCIRIETHLLSSNTPPSIVAGNTLDVIFNLYLKDKIVFKIDSDMFFINEIDLESYLLNNNLVYIPTRGSLDGKEFIWSGIFGINRNIVNQKLSFKSGEFGIDNFGSSCLLTSNKNYSKKVFGYYNLIDVNKEGVGNFGHGLFNTNLNGDCVIDFDNNGYVIKSEGRFDIVVNSIISNKSSEYFGYTVDDFTKSLFERYERLNKLLHSYNFPKPYVVDIMCIDGNEFLIHLKSIASYCEGNHPSKWFTKEYIDLKKKATFKLLKDENG